MVAVVLACIILFEEVGMHNIGFLANIRYANILQLILPVIDTDTNTNTDIYVHFFPHT